MFFYIKHIHTFHTIILLTLVPKIEQNKKYFLNIFPPPFYSYSLTNRIYKTGFHTIALSPRFMNGMKVCYSNLQILCFHILYNSRIRSHFPISFKFNYLVREVDIAVYVDIIPDMLHKNLK